MAIYIAAERPLPLVPWNPDDPAFHVRELSGEQEESVRQQFSKPYVYFVGSNQGCGCGFEYGRDGRLAPRGTSEDSRSRELVAALAQHLTRATRVAGDLQIYTCWGGDEAACPEHHGSKTPQEIGGDAFWFEERQLLSITGGNG